MADLLPNDRAFQGKVGFIRGGTADDIVSAVLYLASGESSFVTSHIPVVDGGYTAQ